MAHPVWWGPIHQRTRIGSANLVGNKLQITIDSQSMLGFLTGGWVGGISVGDIDMDENSPEF